MADYFRIRNGHYYLRVRIPSDLTSTFPPGELLKSLHTKDRKSASIAAAPLFTSVIEVFTLTRTGFISGDQAVERLDGLMGRKRLPGQLRQPRDTSTSTCAKDASPTLEHVFSEYFKDNEPGWGLKTRLEYTCNFKIIKEVIGNKNVSDIDRETVRNLRSTLQKLPSNASKKFPNKTIAQLVEMEGEKLISTTTVNKLLTLLSSVMGHCVKEGMIKANPVEGMKIPKTMRSDEERKAYSPDDLQKMVSHLPAPGDKPERYWVPLIAMYSGMRQGEICGLHKTDLKKVDGVWCFDVNDEYEKNLKNLSSRRIIPVHPFLLERGLLEIVNTANGSIKMWPNLKRRESDGYCYPMGKWFQTFNRKHITSDPRKCFHSLRHSFADTLKQQGVSEQPSTLY